MYNLRLSGSESCMVDVNCDCSFIVNTFIIKQNTPNKDLKKATKYDKSREHLVNKSLETVKLVLQLC